MVSRQKFVGVSCDLFEWKYLPNSCCYYGW